LTVFAVMYSFDTIFMTFSQAIANSATAAMVAAMSQPWAAAQTVPAQVLNNFGLLTDSSTGLGSILTLHFSVIISFFICGACVVLGFIGFFAAALLMLVQGYIGIAYSAFVLILAPVLIPFGLHESTEGMAWSYIKGWLIYGVLYLPLLVVAMNLGSQLMLNAAVTITNQGLVADGGSASLIAQIFSILAVPLAIIGIIYVPNAVLNKVL